MPFTLCHFMQIKASDLDQRCYDMLHGAPVPVALSALERLSRETLRDVRNMSAFFQSKFRDVRGILG